VTVGVERIRSGNLVRRYRANWPTLKGRAFKSFSVAKYGEREARRLAEEARARGLEQFVSERTRFAHASGLNEANASTRLLSG